MKKKIIKTSAALMIALSGISLPAFTTATNHVAAATAEIQNPYNNQTAVNAKADAIIQTAKNLIGKASYSHDVRTTPPYQFACASFINFIFKQNGVDLANSTEEYMITQGYEVPRDQLQKGDLVFFDSNRTNNDPTDHVGLYIGDNKIIHMANPELDVTISDLNSTTYYRNNYVTARRVLPGMLSANPATKGDQILSTAFALRDKVKINSTTNNVSTFTFTNGGLVDYIYKQNGVNLGTSSIKEQMKLGTQVSKDKLKKGDLVFFNNKIGSTTPGLVGIYAGDHRLILASTGYGFVTRVFMVDWYEDHYITARRVIQENATTTPTPTPVPEPEVTPEAPVSSTADNISNLASSLIGKVKFGYVYNESTMTFTPAGLTKYIYKKNGIDLKYTLVGQQATLGQAVQKADLQKGDLVFFSLNNKGTTISTVGIYVGNQQFVYLTKSGTVMERLDSNWATKNYVTARRVL